MQQRARIAFDLADLTIAPEEEALMFGPKSQKTAIGSQRDRAIVAILKSIAAVKSGAST